MTRREVRAQTWSDPGGRRSAGPGRQDRRGGASRSAAVPIPSSPELMPLNTMTRGGGRRVVVHSGGKLMTGQVSGFDPEAAVLNLREDLDRAAGIVRPVAVAAIDMITFAESPWALTTTVLQASPSARILALLLCHGNVVLGVAMPSGVSSRGLFVTPIDAAGVDRVFVPWHAIAAMTDVWLPGEVGDPVGGLDMTKLRRQLGERPAWVRSAPWQSACAAAIARAKAPCMAPWSPCPETTDERGLAVIAALSHAMPFVSRALGPSFSPPPAGIGSDCRRLAGVVALAMTVETVVLATSDPMAPGLEEQLDAALSVGWALVVADDVDVRAWRPGEAGTVEREGSYHVC